MFQRVIYPPLSQHKQLRQPLTVGEKKVLDLFSHKLTDRWEIYIQPHLNGLRPDFVLMNPNGGIGVFEVKDWNLGAMRYFTKEEPWGHTLWAERGGKEFCIQKDNPVSKVNLYKKEIFDLYCPRLQKGNGWAAITAGIIFPFARADDVKKLFKPFLMSTSGDSYAMYQPVSGIEDLSSGNLEAIFPESSRSSSKVMSEDRAKDLRGWLVEPDFASTQRVPLILDRHQRSLAESRTETGFRRIKGPAGSGKSLVLAARAARLANEGKSVLVATFNITLWHYLRDLIVRDLDAPSRIQNIQFTHFHLWCKHACYDVGWKQRYDDLWKHGLQEDVLNVDLPNLANAAVHQPGANKYDAILVDEGQDYHPLWWNVLRNACNPDGEMLLVADATQDVYGTAKSWTDDVMKGAGFRGDWSQLSVSYRLPSDAMDFARSFAEAFLPEDSIDLPEPEQGAFDFGGSHLRWVQCDTDNAEKVCADEILALMRQTGKNSLANADITMLASDMKSGAGVVARLLDYGIHAVNTFSQDQKESRRRKMGFYMGDARVKATTLHSFKGWEARLLVVYVTEVAHAESLALVYAGLTRLKRSREGSWLTVVCSASPLKGYGRTFPDFTDHSSNGSLFIASQTSRTTS